MHPTFKNGTYVFVSKSIYGILLPNNVYEVPWVGTLLYYIIPNEKIDKTLKKPKKNRRVGEYVSIKRNDIIAFNNPAYPRSSMIKRCVAIPGDSIGEYIKGCTSPLITPFQVVPAKGYQLSAKNLTERELLNLQLNKSFRYSSCDSLFIALEDFYFVLGDNRMYSHDSRIWGLIPKSCIKGKCLFSFGF